MVRLVLPGGTDVAEMALFSLDALPADHNPDSAAQSRMQADGSLMLFPTGADGGYLLHAYVDEPIPADIAKYCDKTDLMTGRIKTRSGNLGFGGTESLFRALKPNSNIRTDATAPPGDYSVTAFHTDYPDDLIETAVVERIGKDGQRLLSLPGYVIPVVFLATLVALVLGAWYVAILLVGAAIVGLKFLYFRNTRVQRLKAERLAAEIEFPSIVVEMRSTKTGG